MPPCAAQKLVLSLQKFGAPFLMNRVIVRVLVVNEVASWALPGESLMITKREIPVSLTVEPSEWPLGEVAPLQGCICPCDLGLQVQSPHVTPYLFICLFTYSLTHLLTHSFSCL